MQLAELTGLLSGLKTSVAWAGNLKELAPQVQFRIFLLARKLEKGAKARREEARDVVLAFIESKGETDERGSQHVQFMEGKASRTIKVATSPDPKRVEKLFAEKGLVPGTVIQDVVTTKSVVDVSKLDQLVKLGQITQGEVDACYDVTFSLTATETKDTKKLMEGIAK